MSNRRLRSPAWILSLAALAVAPILALGLVATWRMQDVLVQSQESAVTSAAYAGRLARSLVQIELEDRIHPVQEKLAYANTRGEEDFEDVLRHVWLRNPLLELPQFANENQLRYWTTAIDSLENVEHLQVHTGEDSGLSPPSRAILNSLRAHLARRAAERFGYDPETGGFERQDLVGPKETLELATEYRWIPVKTIDAEGRNCLKCAKAVARVGYGTGEGEYQVLAVSFLLPGGENTLDGMFGAILPFESLMRQVVGSASRRWEEVQPAGDHQSELPLEFAVQLTDLHGKVVAADERLSGWVPLHLTPLVGQDSPLSLEVLAPPKAGLADLKGEATRWTVFLVLAALTLILGAFVVSRGFMERVEDSRLRRHLLSNISHELKTPLSLIRLYTDTLESGRVRDEGEGKKFLSIISREAKRLTHLIDNILNIQRIEQERKTYSYAQVRPDKIVRTTVDAYRFQLTEMGFDLKLDVDDELPLMMLDEEALAQALVNLLDNAAKYSETVKSINVRCSREGSEVCIAVTDRGMGIPAAEHEKIFQSFYRVEKDLVHNVKGSGLGLAVVRHVTDAHGGRIQVESVVGKGSTFTLCLPVDWEPEDS